MTGEKRRFSRVVFKMMAELTAEGGVFRLDEIIDLSVGGCQLDIDQHLKVGSECTLKIALNPADSKATVIVDGVVARSDGRIVGIKFTGITPESLEHLQNIIRYNAPDPDQIDQEIDRRPGIV